MSVYDPIARLYDPWSLSVTEDVPFYLEEARRWGGPVVELGVGTGRIAVPIASDWNEEERTLTLSVRDDASESTMQLAWLDPDEWRTLLIDEGFEIDACYGWFNRTRYTGGEDTIWVTHVRE